MNHLRIQSMSFLVDRIAEYWQWADNSVWNLVKNLSDEEFNRSFGEADNSIRRRYIHLAEDNWEWYADWTGADVQEEPDFDNMTRYELYNLISSYNTKWAKLRSTDHKKTINVGKGDTMITLTFPEMLFHMNNHSTYHRGQIIMALRLLGKNTHMTDYVPHRLSTAK